MKVIVENENINKIKKIIQKSIDNVGSVETIENFGLSYKMANETINPENEFFSPYQCRKILEYYIFIKKELPSYYKDDEVEILIYVDDDYTWGFTINFGENKTEKMSGYATMFWDNENEIPMEIEIYGSVYQDNIKIDVNFKTILELIDYYKQNYFSTIKHFSLKALSIARDSMKLKN
jgi:hypothetical protein